MNPAIGAYVGVSKQTEMLLMTVLALWVNIFDMAIFEISSNLDQVWNVEIDKEIFNPNAEYVIRMLLSGVVLIRTFTLHLYIAFLIAVFWPVCFGTRPTLMLPWLVVSAIKNLGTGLVSIATGGYTCMIYGPLRPACLRFLLSQLIDLSPSFYMWFVGLSLYCDLKKPKSVNRLVVKAMEDQELNVALRRRKVKSMIDEDILRQQFESRSFQKKFLGTSAVEVNEFINRCSYDNLKNKFSRSLDSLLDVLTVQTELLDIEDSEPLDIDSSSTLQQKTAKLLGISMEEIDCIKQNRQTRTDFPAYPVQPQKKTQTISLINSRYESPAKLLPETSLYSPPNIKPIRVTKSELKSAKDIPKLESEFMQSVPEKEVQVYDLTQDESFESLTKMQTVYHATTSSFKSPDVVDLDLDLENANKTSKPANEYGREYLNKNRDRYSRKQDRGKLEDVPIENPTKYKFSNSMSDKSHYLLDEHCFLFDKESMLLKKVPSKEKQRRLIAPPNNTITTNTAVYATKPRFRDNATIINKTPDILTENKSNKIHLKKTKDEIINKNNLKPVEKNQPLKKKIATSDYSNIPVLHRNAKNKNGYFYLDKNKREENMNKKQKITVNEDNKLYTIEENKDVASIENSQAKKTNGKNISYSSVNNKLIMKKKELNEKQKDITILNTNKEEEKTISSHILNDEKKTEIISNKGEKNATSVFSQKNTLPKELTNKKEDNLKAIDECKISVSAEVERINRKNLNISSNMKKDNENIIINNEVEIINRRNYLRSMQYGIPVPFLSLKHSPIRMTPQQREAIIQEEKALRNSENKHNIRANTSQALSEKLLQIIKAKNKAKADKLNAENASKEKNNKTEVIDTVVNNNTQNNNNNEFEFTATLDNKDVILPVKSSSRNKQLEFHFKEKIIKTKDNKMEDLFKKKVATDRKDSKTSDKDKLTFPSYFSNKINRMITDACQIRKKSCKKINLFLKVPTNTSTKQRNKLSTVELFRKQSPQKTNLFDMTRKLSIGKLDIPPFKGKNKQIINRIEINLFNTEEGVKTKKLSAEKVLVPPKTSPKSTSKTSVHTNINNNIDNNETTICDVQIESKEKNLFFEETIKAKSLINSFMSFKPSVNSHGEKLPTSPKIENNEHICQIEMNQTNKEETNNNLPSNNEKVVKKTDTSSTTDQKSCKKLSEQAMDKIMSLTKTNVTPNVVPQSSNCKRLSEQAINKIISLTNTGYSHVSHKQLKTNVTDSKLNDSVVYGSCKKLSDYAISKLLAITSPKTSLTDGKPSFLLSQIAKTENEEEIIEGVPINITRSEHVNDTTDGDRVDSNDNLKATQLKKSNSLIDSPIVKYPKIIPSLTKVISNVEIQPCMENEYSDTNWNKSLIIALIEGVVIMKSVDKYDCPEDTSVQLVSSTNNVFLNDSNSNMGENISRPTTGVGEKNCNESLNNSTSSNETLLSTKGDKNCNWMSQDTHQKESQNIPNSEEETICEKTVSQEHLSPKKENLSNPVTKGKNQNCDTESKASNNLHAPHEEITSFKMEGLTKNESNGHCGEEVIENISNNKVETSQNNIILSSNNEACHSEKQQNISETKIDKTISPNINIFLKNDDKNYNNEYQTNIPIVKIEKECKGTSQHRIKLISSTDLNFDKKSNHIKKPINTKNPNIIEIRHEHEGNLQNKNILLSSLRFETPYNSNLPYKEEKICRGSSHHNIKLISSSKHESASESNLCNIEKLPYHTKDDSFIHVKEQKVCKGSSQNYIKLISSSKDESTGNNSVTHKEALSNILKDYQTAPIMKEEKICKGTSKHKVKLVSSYKKDAPNKINLFHTETEYKSNKNKNITIIKEEKMCEGTLHHSIKLISSSKLDSPNKTIFIVKEQLPKAKEIIPVTENVQTNLFVNVNTANGKQNLTVIQKQNDDKESTKHEVNLFFKDKMINTDGNKKKENNLEDDDQMETFRKITLISNTIQNFLESDTEKLIARSKGNTNLELLKNESNGHPLAAIKSSEILSSLIHKVETSIKTHETKKEDIFDETHKFKYRSNQIDFGCQTSTLSKKILYNNPKEISKNLTRTKSITKSGSAKSYQDLNLQKIAFATTTINKRSNFNSESKSSNDEKKDSASNLSSRGSRNSSYVSIHKERLDKAKSTESDMNKSGILQNCALLEDGYTRLYNLLGVKRENFNSKANKKRDSSFHF